MRVFKMGIRKPKLSGTFFIIDPSARYRYVFGKNIKLYTFDIDMCNAEYKHPYVIGTAKELIDYELNDNEKKALLMNPYLAFIHACIFGPSTESRSVCCTQSTTAYQYALCIDKGPCDETRNACKTSTRALMYAKNIDGKPNPVTYNNTISYDRDEYVKYFKEKRYD